MADIRDVVAAELGLTAEDLALRIPSGSPVFDSRVHWAVTYMAQAGLLRRPRRGVVELTERGQEVLAQRPDRVDNVMLSRFPEFLEFKARARSKQTDPVAALNPSLDQTALETTPREQLEKAVEEANAAVATELLERIRERDPVFLEQLVLRLLTAMGYGGRAGAAEHLGRSGDQGLDGVIRQDALGLDRVYVQAKRYGPDHSVGRPEIQAFGRSSWRPGRPRSVHSDKPVHRRRSRLRRASAGAPCPDRRSAAGRANGAKQRRRTGGGNVYAQTRRRRLLREPLTCVRHGNGSSRPVMEQVRRLRATASAWPVPPGRSPWSVSCGTLRCMPDPQMQEIAELLRERNAIDEKIAAIIKRPMTAGHLGEWVAARIFGIQLESSAVAAAIDGRFVSGPLRDRTVNAKWYLKREGLLDVTHSDALDYYLVLTGPASAALSSRGATRPWCIASVYLFDAKQVLGELRARGVKTGTATSARAGQWAAAEIYPRASNALLTVGPEQVALLRLFAPLTS
jgi:restriction endonuclease Mrr